MREGARASQRMLVFELISAHANTQHALSSVHFFGLFCLLFFFAATETWFQSQKRPERLKL